MSGQMSSRIRGDGNIMATVVGNGSNNQSSEPGWGSLLFT